MILKPIATAQEVQFYIRPMVNTSNGYSIILRNESTNTTQTVTPTLLSSTTFLRTFNATFTGLTEATWYTIRLFENNGSTDVKRLYFGRVYVTAQTDFDKYTLNEGKYTEYNEGNSSREYITY